MSKVLPAKSLLSKVAIAAVIALMLTSCGQKQAEESSQPSEPVEQSAVPPIDTAPLDLAEPTLILPKETEPQDPPKALSEPGEKPELLKGEPIDSKPLELGAIPKVDNKVTLEAGAYCYLSEGATQQAIAELLVEPTNDVSGILEATAGNNGSTAYTQRIAGVLEEETLSASVMTDIDNAQQNSQVKWTLNQETLSNDQGINLKRVSCEQVIAIKANRKNRP